MEKKSISFLKRDLDEIDQIAEEEGRSRSEVLRTAWHHYRRDRSMLATMNKLAKQLSSLDHGIETLGQTSTDTLAATKRINQTLDSL